MMNGPQRRFARYVEWAVHRNPMYLISAALMAAGARLLLAGPSGAAGDIKLILLTLSVLQVYEWAVTGILLVLHGAKRSPEDEPSLLLVAVLFWTGPMAATIEMTAFRPDLGTSLAAGACLIALAELRLACRILGLRLTTAGQLLGSACLVLLAAAAPLLKIPETASGTNELFLYGAWWIFGGVVLIFVPVARTYRRRGLASGTVRAPTGLGREIAFLTMTIVATAAHLVGMNHAFYCHAVPFYASPLIIAVSVVGMELLSLATKRNWCLLAAFGVLPGAAILLTLRPFDAEVPVILLPKWLRDPMLSVLLVAGAAWWFGYSRHRAIALLHAGNASFGLAAFRAVNALIAESAAPIWPSAEAIAPRGVWIAALYMTAGYLVLAACLRRSRIEALLALAVHQAAVVLLVWESTPADNFIICLVAGWSVLVGLHLAVSRLSLVVRLVPIAFLAIAPWTCESASSVRWQAGVHAVAMILALFLVGQLWRWTRYRLVAILLVAIHITVVTERWAMHGSHRTEVVLVGAGFALLACGALISWYKRRLLDSIRVPDVETVADRR
ncbi:MAG: hypothetical protein ACYSVY_15985 [Planctomycetota bacterium]|jgi:hypothetical protein